MKGSSVIKWLFALVVVLIIGFFGFVFKVNEGQCAVVTRFGAVRTQVTQAGMYLRLPWPFEDVQIQDARKRYLDSGYLETLTHDKKNVILQTYAIWSVADPLKYYTSVGDTALAETYLNDLITNAKNGTMGNYDLSTLVSMNEDDIKIAEIEKIMLEEVQPHALEQYGLQIHELRIKRVGLPATNVQSVFAQMQADRQKYIDQLLAEGERDAQIIKSESDAEAAAIVAEGRESAAQINAETEREVASIYASAHSQDPELYEFLQKLTALENSVDENTVMIITMDDPPFDILGEAD
jgi:membrane protease subunit HflC